MRENNKSRLNKSNDNNKSKSNKGNDKNLSKSEKQYIPYIFAIIVLLAIIVYSGIQLFEIFSEYYASDNEYKQLSEKYITNEAVEDEPDSSDSSEPGNNIKEAERLEIDFEGLFDINSDVIGWIHFDNIGISYPVVQTDNNDYYIEHTFSNEENKAGTIFLDYRNYASFNDKNTYLYGHNMKNNSMFGLILNYVDKEYYEANPHFWIYTPEARYKYEIFSTFEESAIGPAYQIDFDDDNDFEEFLNLIDKRKYYNAGTKPSSSDNIIALSTCTKEDRFLVFAKRVEKEYY